MNINNRQDKYIESLLEKIEEQEIEIKVLTKYKNKCESITSFIYQMENTETYPTVNEVIDTIYNIFII